MKRPPAESLFNNALQWLVAWVAWRRVPGEFVAFISFFRMPLSVRRADSGIVVLRKSYSIRTQPSHCGGDKSWNGRRA